mgnify:CR=1 FL=1
MLKKRIVVCLDVKDGRTTKGVKFKDNIDIGDPVEMAAEYYRHRKQKMAADYYQCGNVSADPFPNLDSKRNIY